MVGSPLEKLAIYYSYIYNISPNFIARSSPQKAFYVVDFHFIPISSHTTWQILTKFGVYHIREVWTWILQSLLLLSSFKCHSCHELYRQLFQGLYSLLLDTCIMLCFDRWVLHVSKGMDYYQSCKKNELKHLHVYKYMSTKRIDIMIKLQVI